MSAQKLKSGSSGEEVEGAGMGLFIITNVVELFGSLKFMLYHFNKN